jgi:hypothetical protein
MKRNILPARRLRLRAGTHVKTALLLLMMIAMTVGAGLGATWFVSSGGTILRDKQIWAHGVQAQDGTIRAKRTAKLIPWLIASYDGTVRYVDAEGASFEGSIDFWTMFGGPDTDNNAELRYDPEHHERFAISWGIEASGARWRAVIVLTLLMVLLVAAFGFGAWAIWHNARAEARVAATGDEVELRVVSATPLVKDGKPTSKYRYQLELDGKAISRESEWLLTCGPNDSRVLGLMEPGNPASVIVIRSDLAPLVVSQAERRDINARAEQARAVS